MRRNPAAGGWRFASSRWILNPTVGQGLGGESQSRWTRGDRILIICDCDRGRGNGWECDDGWAHTGINDGGFAMRSDRIKNICDGSLERTSENAIMRRYNYAIEQWSHRKYLRCDPIASKIFAMDPMNKRTKLRCATCDRRRLYNVI